MTKKKKIKVIIFAVIAICLLGSISFINFELLKENIMVLIWGEDTIYAPKYNEAAFWKITKGMTKSEVLSLLGPPLWKSGDNESNWNYTNFNKEKYRERVIVFDKNDKVLEKRIGYYAD
jgi:outer membrane protein assembly factor BamE (lipoprotein component of BamABCDE complex)